MMSTVSRGSRLPEQVPQTENAGGMMTQARHHSEQFVQWQRRSGNEREEVRRE